MAHLCHDKDIKLTENGLSEMNNTRFPWETEVIIISEANASIPIFISI